MESDEEFGLYSTSAFLFYDSFLFLFTMRLFPYSVHDLSLLTYVDTSSSLLRILVVVPALVFRNNLPGATATWMNARGDTSVEETRNMEYIVKR